MKVRGEGLRVVRGLAKRWKREALPLRKGHLDEAVARLVLERFKGSSNLFVRKTPKANIFVLRPGGETDLVWLVEYKRVKGEKRRAPVVVKRYPLNGQVELNDRFVNALQRRRGLFKQQQDRFREKQPVPKPLKLVELRDKHGVVKKVAWVERSGGVSLDDLNYIAKTPEEIKTVSSILEKFREEHPELRNTHATNFVVDPKTGKVRRIDPVDDIDWEVMIGPNAE